MAVSLVVACVRLHLLYTEGNEGSFAGPGWMIAFACMDGFMLVSVLALAITQASQARPQPHRAPSTFPVQSVLSSAGT